MNEGVIGERQRRQRGAFQCMLRNAAILAVSDLLPPGWRRYEGENSYTFKIEMLPDRGPLVNMVGIKFNGPQRILAAIAIACLLLCLFTPLNRLFERAFLVQMLEEWGSLAALLFVLIYIVTTAIGVPGTAMTIAGGAVFGLGWGTFWSVVGATLGALAAFWIARYLWRDWAMRKFGQHKMLMRFNQAVAKEPLKFVLAVRFVPISPFNLVNFLFGLTPIDWVDYTAGTFFGIIPGTLAYTWLGVTGEQALQGGDRLPFFLALAFLAVLAVLPVFVRRCQ